MIALARVRQTSPRAPPMTKLSGEYRAKAAELRAEARDERNPQTKAGLEKLVLGYIHLAELAEKTPAQQYRPRRLNGAGG